MLLKMKWTLSWIGSGGCVTSLDSVAPSSVSMLLAFAMDGSFPRRGDEMSETMDNGKMGMGQWNNGNGTMGMEQWEWNNGKMKQWAMEKWTLVSNGRKNDRDTHSISQKFCVR